MENATPGGKSGQEVRSLGGDCSKEVPRKDSSDRLRWCQEDLDDTSMEVGNPWIGFKRV